MKKTPFIQFLFWLIIIFIVYQSIKINRIIFILNWKELVSFILPMFLIIPLFILILKFLIPEILSLYEIKINSKENIIKNSYLIIIFYLITTILLHIPMRNLIVTFTILNQIGKDIALAYAHIVTPFMLLLLRKIGNREFFRGIILGDIILILFILVIRIPIEKLNLIYNDFLWIITGIIVPTIIFGLLDIFISLYYNKK